VLATACWTKIQPNLKFLTVVNEVSCGANIFKCKTHGIDMTTHITKLV